MKIYKHQPLYLIQLTFRWKGENPIHLTLCETTVALAKIMLESLFPNETKPKSKAYKTRIEIRERIGGKNGKFLAHSFYGYTPAEARAKVFEYVSLLNSRENTN